MAVTAMDRFAMTTTFAAGELDADFVRATPAAATHGAGRLRNVLVGPAGGVARRPGLRHLGAAVQGGRLIAADGAGECGCLVVASAGKAMIAVRGRVVAELAAPWQAGHLPGLSWRHAADRVLVTHPDLPPQCIQQMADEWRIEPCRLGKDDGLPADEGTAAAGPRAGHQVPPCRADGAVFHVAEDGRTVLARLADGTVRDLAAPARHLMAGPVDLAWQPERRRLYVAMADGTLAVAILSADHRRAAWTAQVTDGAFRAVAVVDGVVYVLVERDGGTMLECFDHFLSLDAAISRDSEVAVRSWSGLTHLEGRPVWVIADGGAPVRAQIRDGMLRLDRPAHGLVVGLAYAHEIEPLSPAVTADGALTAQTSVRLAWARLRLLDAGALCVDAGQGAAPLPLGPRPVGRLFSGDVEIRAIGGRRPATQPAWRIAQDLPVPCTVLAATTGLAVVAPVAPMAIKESR